LPLPRGYEQGADTTVGFDGRGTGFVVALMAHGGGGYASRVSRGGIFLWTTHDGGRRFSKPRALYVGRGFQDHPWLAIRRGRHSLLFIAWTNGAGLQFVVSRNGGRTFTRPRVLLAGKAPSDPVVTVGPRGAVFVFFEEFMGQTIRLFSLHSSDDGRHFQPAQRLGSVAAPPLGGGPKGGSFPPPLLGAATDGSSGTAAVAISGQDPQAGHPVIELWRRGASGRWRGPTKPIHGPSAVLSQEQPRLAYAHKRLYLSFFTISRQGQTSEQVANTTASHSPTLLTAPPFKASGFLGDYQALALSGKSGYAIWNGAVDGHLQLFSAHVTTR
jgi:hypothetical protein